ncbi:hypothetical protein GCM10022280_12880 [Sphingomonas swuensis]|uniref:DUF4163 domain-containing protein n=1 Tax=Sphingomonas swuensis TaxID=977800 RepID=A0ABP7ST09_9SPHN
MAVALLPLLLVAAPVSIAETSRDLAFSYRWSSEAEAIPALSRRFRADAASERKRMLGLAKAEKAFRAEAKLDWNGLDFRREWKTMGQSARLLSLLGSVSAYTGGAHSNSGTKALLWDRRLGKELTIAALLRPGMSWDGAIRQPYCVLLDRERTRRRQQPVVRGDWAGACPALKELSLALSDKDRDGLLDHVLVTADPYVAGSYAEGAYAIELPLTATMLGRLKTEYRSGFEPQPPVQ